MMLLLLLKDIPRKNVHMGDWLGGRRKMGAEGRRCEKMLDREAGRAMGNRGLCAKKGLNLKIEPSLSRFRISLLPLSQPQF